MADDEELYEKKLREKLLKGQIEEINRRKTKEEKEDAKIREEAAKKEAADKKSKSAGNVVKNKASSLYTGVKGHFQEGSFLKLMVILGVINFFVEFLNGWKTNSTTIAADIIFLVILLFILWGKESRVDFILVFIIFLLEVTFNWVVSPLEAFWLFEKWIWQFWLWGAAIISWGKSKQEVGLLPIITRWLMFVLIIYLAIAQGFFKGATETLTETFETGEVKISQEDWDKYSQICKKEATNNYQLGKYVDEWWSINKPIGEKSPSMCVINNMEEAEKQEEELELLTGWKEEQSADHIKVKSKTYTPTKDAIEYELQISNPKDKISITDIKCLNEYSSERDISVYYKGKDYNKEIEWLPELANLKGRELPGGEEFYYPIDITCFPSGLKKGNNPHTIEVMIEGINLKARSTLLYTNKEAVETMLYNYRFEYPDKRKPPKPDSKNLDKWKKEMFNYYKAAYDFFYAGQVKETIDIYFPAGYVASTHLEKLAVIELGLIKSDYEAVPIIGLDPDDRTVLVWQIIIRNLEDFGRIEEIRNIEVRFPKFMKPIKDYCDLELVDDSGKTEDVYKMTDKDALMRIKTNLQSLKKGKGFIPVIRECRVEVDPDKIDLTGIFPREVEVRMDINYKIEEEFKVYVEEEDIGPDAMPTNVGNDPQLVRNNLDIVNKIKSYATTHSVPEKTAVAVALQESRLSHYSKSGNVLHAGDDWGIMQINEDAHTKEGCFSSTAEKSGMCAVDSCIDTNVKDSIDCNIEAGIKLLSIYYNNHKNGVTVCGRTYTGWDAAVRAYNGLNPDCGGPTALYVENINAREEAIIV